MENENVNEAPQQVFETKFCKHCGEKFQKMRFYVLIAADRLRN